MREVFQATPIRVKLLFEPDVHFRMSCDPPGTCLTVTITLPYSIGIVQLNEPLLVRRWTKKALPALISTLADGL